MTNVNLGNQLNQIVALAKSTMFDQGELAQLAYGAFDIAAQSMQNSKAWWQAHPFDSNSARVHMTFTFVRPDPTLASSPE